MYSKDCGPAKARAQVSGMTYRFSSGSCEVGVERKVRFFGIGIGLAQDSWTGPAIDSHTFGVSVRHYTGPGTYSTRDRAGVSVRVGKHIWHTVPALAVYRKLGVYRGPGTVTVNSGEQSGTFSAPVPDDSSDLTSDSALADAPTVSITGSFTCR